MTKYQVRYLRNSGTCSIGGRSCEDSRDDPISTEGGRSNNKGSSRDSRDSSNVRLVESQRVSSRSKLVVRDTGTFEARVSSRTGCTGRDRRRS
jgi:hypothetical protein